ncbi:MAG: hypothetical protein ABIZ04_05340 [Opitutus sp.]
MSETNSNRASLVSIIAIFVLFGLFLAVVYYVYVPRQTGAFAGDGIHSVQQRQKTLTELHAKEAAQAKSYGWVDQKAGVVRLPLDRAMELTLQKYTAKQ